MQTCVSMDCPFIDVCKNYSLFADRTGCKTQDRIVEAALRLEKKRKAEKSG